MNKLLLDIGGTFIKCSDGRTVPVDSAGSREDISASLREAVGDAASLDYVGVAIPGPFDYGRGIFLMKHKYVAVYGSSFRELAGIPATVRMRFMHDVNCQLLGEMTYGNGRGCDNVALVSIGTGLGFALAEGGSVLEDENGSPLVKIWNRPYRDGILEDYASKRGFAKVFGELSGSPLPEGMTVKEMAEAAALEQDMPEGGGRRIFSECFAEVGRTIACAIAPVLVEHGVECLLFGGQISRSFGLMEKAVMVEISDLASLRRVAQVSDFDNYAFNGLV